MTDILQTLNSLKRPRLLISAARIGLEDYRRDIHLPRQLGPSNPRSSQDALSQLIEIEQQMNTNRTTAEASYSVARHVEVMIAMMGEARILRASHRV